MGTTLPYSNIPAYEEFVRIDSVNFICDSVVAVGDTINLEIKFTSFVSDSATIALTRYSGLKIIDEDSTKKGLFEYIKLDTNQSITKNYKIVATGIIPTKIQFFIKIFHSIPEVTDLSYFTQELLPVGNGQGFGIPVRVASDCVQSLWMDDNDDECDNYTFLTQQCEATFIDSNAVDISGSVSFEDWNAPGIDSIHPVQIKSPYTEVWLFFKPINNNKQLIHPRDYSPIDGPIEGIHYAKCDDNGVFHFNFKYTKAKLDCNQSYEILLLVAKENEAIWLESPTNHIKVYGIYNNYRRPMPAHIRFFKELGEGNIVNINGNYTGTWNFNLDFGDGSIFRHFTLSRKFLKRIYQTENLSSILELSQIRILSKPKYNAKYHPDGLYYSAFNYTYIQIIFPDHAESRDIPHEYGHYLDYKNFHLGGYPVEGFAVFFSWVYRTWLNTNYGDRIDVLIDNCEIGPYTEVTNEYYLSSDDYPNNPINSCTQYKNRFGNISKIFENRDECAFACFLWNLYDGKNMGEFGYSKYDGKENDDVDGFFHQLFFSLININRSDVTQIKEYIKQQFNVPELSESIDNIFSFMDFGDYKSLSELPTKMKSPNINFSYSTDDLYLNVNWGPSQSYNFNISTEPFHLGPYLTITNNCPNNNVYKVSTFKISNYKNTEDGVRWYNYDFENQRWNEPNIVLNYPAITSINYLPLYTQSKYKVATYNEGGDSYLPFAYNYNCKQGIDEFIDNNDIIDDLYYSNNLVYYHLNINAKINITIFDNNGKSIINNNHFEQQFAGNKIYNIKDFVKNYKIKFIRIIAISDDNLIQNKILKIIE